MTLLALYNSVASSLVIPCTEIMQSSDNPSNLFWSSSSHSHPLGMKGPGLQMLLYTDSATDSQCYSALQS